MPQQRSEPVVLGIDVGSTTVKAVALDPNTFEILWSDYQRHQTKQPEKVLELLNVIEAAFPASPRAEWRVFMTGSGAAPLCVPLGAKFVQEVNAVTLAVENLHPDVGSVIELGGQDAKIIMFKANQETGDKTAQTSMNDKCASGTGATIDKCVLKVAMPRSRNSSSVLRSSSLVESSPGIMIITGCGPLPCGSRRIPTMAEPSNGISTRLPGGSR
jgi:activator of 2-hydroxyglutaryl-CoA dehydratase